MARFSGATWRPIADNFTDGGQDAVYGVVIHIMDGSLAGTDSWFRNTSAQASSHFGTGRAGQLYQWVDTSDRAWAQAGGNRTWLSVENEGRGGDALTADQITRCAEVLAWAHKTHGVPLQLASGPSGRGLGYHAMGGSAWGGHTSCPGSKVVAQLDDILSRAKSLAGGGSSGGGGGTGPSRSQVTINGLVYGYGAHGDHVTKVGKALVSKGYGKHYASGPGPDWSDADTLNYADFQRSLGYSGADADGVPGETSLKALLGSLPGASKPPAYQSFPGAAWFKKNPKSPIVTAMGKRLVAVGCSAYASGPGAQWTSADKASYAKWQRKNGYTGTAADGWPGKATWDALKVPRVS
ncbi:peptidoglycan-binding protein [Streptomyces sp. CBMA370]|uniref:peptidoglycan-binding protein n=1 Tax=Streptomyces sp. CBMA370 TaxID=1930278 RepID=UPI001CB739DC|nr:peptidoglycan-binding protein [Streptomyces sp. CBMA370]